MSEWTRERLIELLREIEWGGNCADDGPHCPDCGGTKPITWSTGEVTGGHYDYCDLVKVLKEEEP